MPYGRGGGGSDFDRRGRISLWPNDRKDNDRAPDLRGIYTDESGNEWEVSLWENARPEGNQPVLSGTIKEPANRSGGQRGPRRDDRRDDRRYDRGNGGRYGSSSRNGDRNEDRRAGPEDRGGSRYGGRDYPRGNEGGNRPRYGSHEDPPPPPKELDDKIPF